MNNKQNTTADQTNVPLLKGSSTYQQKIPHFRRPMPSEIRSDSMNKHRNETHTHTRCTREHTHTRTNQPKSQMNAVKKASKRKTISELIWLQLINSSKNRLDWSGFSNRWVQFIGGVRLQLMLSLFPWKFEATACDRQIWMKRFFIVFFFFCRPKFSFHTYTKFHLKIPFAKFVLEQRCWCDTRLFS